MRATRARLRALAGATLMVAVITGCGTQPADGPAKPSGSESPPESAGSASQGAEEKVPSQPDDVAVPAPPVTVRSGDHVLDLTAWTTCWSEPGGENGCWDGAPPDDPPDLGRITGDVQVTFPHDGWSFEATLRHPVESCSLSLPVELEPVDERTWRLPGTGPAGAYEVDVMGRGPEGDVHVTFAMQTTRAGAVARPTSALDMFYGQDDSPVIYGAAHLALANLPSTPEEASGLLVVEASDGRRTEVGLIPADTGCVPVGTVSLTEASGAASERDAVAEFGPEPYQIEAQLRLDGTQHVATVSWPQDVDDETSSIPLVYDPPLPAAVAGDYAPYLD